VVVGYLPVWWWAGEKKWDANCNMRHLKNKKSKIKIFFSWLLFIFAWLGIMVLFIYEMKMKPRKLKIYWKQAEKGTVIYNMDKDCEGICYISLPSCIITQSCKYYKVVQYCNKPPKAKIKKGICNA
jgi:hypothetical protein